MSVPRGKVRNGIRDVPSKPLAALLRTIAQRQSAGIADGPIKQCDLIFESVCSRAGISARNVRRWESGEQPTAKFDIADMILCRTGRLWFDVYDPQRWPDLYSPEDWQAVVLVARAAFEGDAEDVAA